MSHIRAASNQHWSPLSLGDLAAWYDASAAGAALQDGAAQFTAACKHKLLISDNPSISSGDIPFEIGFWLYLESYQIYQTILCKRGNGGIEYMFRVPSADKLLTFYMTSGGMVSLSASSFGPLTTGVWYFCRFWHDPASDTLNIQINNGAVDSVSFSSGMFDGDGSLTFGGDPTDGYGVISYRLDGRLDSVYFTKRISTTAEVTALYNAGAGRTYADLTAANGLDTFAANLVSWWNLDEASGTRYDAHGDNDLTETFDDIISPTLLNGGFETLGGGETLGSELLSNTGFETAGGGDPDIFGTWNESAGSGAIADETTLVYAGSHAAKLSYVTGQSYLRNNSSGLTVTASTRYKLTFWTRGDGSVSGRFAVKDITNDAYIISLQSTGITGTSYTQYTLYFTTPAGCVSIYLYLYSPSSAGDAYFDDVSVKQVTSGDIFGSWTESYAGGANMVADTASPYAGTYACRFDIDSANSSAYLLAAVLVSTKKYSYSLRAKADAGSPTIRVGTVDGYTYHTLTTSYAEYTGEITVTIGLNFLIRNSSAASRKLYIDNVTLRSAEIPRAAGIAQKACADTEYIAKLMDQSGYARHLTQTDMTKRLVYRTNQQNGLPAIVGVGGDDSLSNAADLIGTGAVTVFAAFKAVGWGGGGFGRFLDNASLPSSPYASTRKAILATASSASSSLSLATPFALALTRNSSGSTSFYINGALSGAAGQSAGTPAAGSPTYIGNRSAGDRGFDGNLYELGIFTRILSASEIARLNSYLRNKWGI